MSYIARIALAVISREPVLLVKAKNLPPSDAGGNFIKAFPSPPLARTASSLSQPRQLLLRRGISPIRRRFRPALQELQKAACPHRQMLAGRIHHVDVECERLIIREDDGQALRL